MTRFWITTALTTIGLLAFLFALAWAIWGLQVATAGIYGRGEARIQIQSAESRISAYNHFFNVCAAIQGHEASIDALNAQLDETADEKTRDRLLTNLTGVTAERLRSIREYNADATKDYTIGQFRDSDLPFQLRAGAYPEEGATTCTASS